MMGLVCLGAYWLWRNHPSEFLWAAPVRKGCISRWPKKIKMILSTAAVMDLHSRNSKLTPGQGDRVCVGGCWPEVSLLVSGFRRNWWQCQIEVALLWSLECGDGELRAVHHRVLDHLHVALVQVVQIRWQAGEGDNRRVREGACDMTWNADRDSYRSEALRIPSMEPLFVLVFCREHGQVLSVSHVSYNSSGGDMSPRTPRKKMLLPRSQ